MINNKNQIQTKNRNTALNIGIVAHVDAGKTTITEQLLYKCGVIAAVGRVDTGNTTTDGMEVEKQRGITIRATTVSMQWKDQRINLLDTPGHVDFVAEVERSLSVLDGAVLAISAREGVQVQTRIIYNALKRLKIPTVIFINKIDRMGVDLAAVYEDIEKSLQAQLFYLNTVKDEGTREASLISYENDERYSHLNYEHLALEDETFMSHYLESEKIDALLVQETAVRCFNNSQINPVLHGAALHGLGMDELLDVISNWFEPQVQEQLSARIYKIDRDEYDARRCFARLYGGTLVLRETYPIFQSDADFKVRKMALLQGAKPISADRAKAGDIVILYTDALFTESIIGEEPPYKNTVRIATPTLKANVAYSDLAVRRQLCSALDILTDEDPFLAYHIHPVTEALEIKLFGVVQKEIIETLLRLRFGIHTHIDEPSTIYKERPLMKGTACIFMYKEGNHLPATIGLEIEPLEVGSGFVFENGVSYGDLKKPFQNAVLEGIEKGLEEGLEGWEITDLRVKFTYSEFNSVDSTPSDYRKLAPEVFRKALEQAGTELLEPLLKFELTVPQYAVGRAISDVLKMRGTVNEPVMDGEFAVLEGLIPVETSKSYNAELSDYTGGKGVIITSFHGYRTRT